MSQKLSSYCLLSRPSYFPINFDDRIYTELQTTHLKATIKRNEYAECAYHLKKPSIIEPESGYVIMEPNILIPDSVSFSEFSWTPDKMKYFSSVPRVSDVQSAFSNSVPVRSERIVISLRHAFEQNYGHNLIQLLPVLALLDDCGIPKSVPIVISSHLSGRPFFQEIMKRGTLRERIWIVQGDEFIHADEVVFARTLWPSPKMLESTLDMLDAPYCTNDFRRRLFIDRKTRRIQNQDQLAPILDMYNFETIRPEEYTLAQQIEIFSHADVVCGTMGAALTNVVFRRGASTKLLEVRPRGSSDTFFSSLCNTCGFEYDFVVGTPYNKADDHHSDFTMDPLVFERFLAKSLSKSPDAS